MDTAQPQFAEVAGTRRRCGSRRWLGHGAAAVRGGGWDTAPLRFAEVAGTRRRGNAQRCLDTSSSLAPARRRTGRRSARFRRGRRNRPLRASPSEVTCSPSVGPAPTPRRKTSSRWNPFLPAPASRGSHPLVAKPPRGGTCAPPRRGGGRALRDRAWRRRRRHRACGPALAPSDAGFALSDSPELVGERIAASSARSSSLAACRPITRLRAGSGDPQAVAEGARRRSSRE